MALALSYKFERNVACLKTLCKQSAYIVPTTVSSCELDCFQVWSWVPVELKTSVHVYRTQIKRQEAVCQRRLSYTGLDVVVCDGHGKEVRGRQAELCSQQRDQAWIWEMIWLVTEGRLRRWNTQNIWMNECVCIDVNRADKKPGSTQYIHNNINYDSELPWRWITTFKPCLSCITLRDSIYCSTLVFDQILRKQTTFPSATNVVCANLANLSMLTHKTSLVFH